ncbi:MAG TPA: hypothetical protein VF412_06225 [Bdellovibrio sp.]|uniref:hypothetical protein n=1 Tax=Bdellovibrio sp. TaxID=28201 RepID=UPI002EF684F2
MIKRSLLSASLVLLSLPFAKAETTIPVQARLFIGTTNASPSNVNDTLSSQSLQKINGVTQAGLEITYPLLSHLDVGVRYTKRFATNEESPSNPSTDYYSKLDQDSVLLVARVPVIKNDFFRLDGFAGFGGSNTTLTIKTATQDGELTRKATDGWLATPYTAAGASMAFGFKHFFLVFEGGVESNKVDGFKQSGTVPSGISTLDLSGGYFTIGLMFDGVPGTIGK